MMHPFFLTVVPCTDFPLTPLVFNPGGGHSVSGFPVTLFTLFAMCLTQCSVNSYPKEPFHWSFYIFALKVLPLLHNYRRISSEHMEFQ